MSLELSLLRQIIASLDVRSSDGSYMRAGDVISFTSFEDAVSAECGRNYCRYVFDETGNAVGAALSLLSRILEDAFFIPVVFLDNVEIRQGYVIIDGKVYNAVRIDAKKALKYAALYMEYPDVNAYERDGNFNVLARAPRGNFFIIANNTLYMSASATAAVLVPAIYPIRRLVEKI